jgi:hypothetical protein
VALDRQGNAFISTDVSRGAVTWSGGLIDGPSSCTAAPCEIEELYANDSHGTRLIDRAGPGAGRSIGGVAIDGDLLSWTNDGADRQATLAP